VLNVFDFSFLGVGVLPGAVLFGGKAGGVFDIVSEGCGP